MNPRKISLAVGFISVIIIFLYTQNSMTNKTKTDAPAKDNTERLNGKKLFDGGILSTDMTVHSIPLEKILDGGPGKDGIPAIIDPDFTSIADAKKWLSSDADGLVVTIGQTTKFYPFNILVWHEIANDIVEGAPVVITFCPLCGSAIVFDANFDGKREFFGVSGKLYESNLLMYDTSTQSLWSQIIGEAVVGSKTGSKLTILPSQVMSFTKSSEIYPSMLVMSPETGHNRNYEQGPYGDYNNNDSLYFPISVNDTRLPTKEIMYVTNFNNNSIAWQKNALSETTPAIVTIGSSTLRAQIVDGEVVVKQDNDIILPGYTAMWFSWAIHHQTDGIVWKK